MEISFKQIAVEQLGLHYHINGRHEFFERFNQQGSGLSFREQLRTIKASFKDFVLPPKRIPEHPRLAPLSAIHFDHYNSSVTNYKAPALGDQLNKQLIKHGLILGTCLNFLSDQDGNLYGFCGNLEEGFQEEEEGVINVNFKLTLFDNNLQKMDEFEIVRFSRRKISGGQLPINLGYFVMDEKGRVIVVRNRNEVAFVKKGPDNTLQVDQVWRLSAQLAQTNLPPSILEEGLGQVLPDPTTGYWAIGLGQTHKEEGFVMTSAYLLRINDWGRITDTYHFEGEAIENGMAIDQSGVYIVTTSHLYKFAASPSGKIQRAWLKEYPGTKGKPLPETISKRGSGSTPTLFGSKDDLIAITDNADHQINLRVYKRQTGEQVCFIPLFEPGASANENTVLAYEDNVVVQNWSGASGYRESMRGLQPGLSCFSISRDRKSYRRNWHNDSFASTATARLCTRTGLIYGTIQKSSVLERYAMAFIDFRTGKQVHELELGRGRGYRIAMSPAYILPDGRLIQPTRRGLVEISSQ